MKFLIHIPQLIFGGAEKVLVSFANCLVENGHEVEILETYERGLLKPQFDKRVKFNTICSDEYTKKYYASLEQIKNEKNIFNKLGLFCKNAFSKVVGYERFAKRLAAKHYQDKLFDVAINYLELEDPSFILNQIKANKYFQWIHTDPSLPETKSGIDKFAKQYLKMDKIFCVSQYAAEKFKMVYPYLADKTEVIYNFFDTEYILKSGKVPYNYSTSDTVLLSVGRLTAPKQYLRFLDVLAKLRDEGYSFVWNILGIGEEYDLICKKTNDLKLNDYVVLHGKQDNPYKYMSGCDLFVLPSGWEGFPTVTVEAKVLGCPVLATDVSGIKEQLVHGVTGWIVDNSRESIYDGLKYLLDNPQEIEKIRNNQGIEKIVDKNNTYERFMEYVNNS